MVVPFGFSVGDIIAGASTLIQCIQAFQATGGAADKYEEAIDFLEGLKVTLESTKNYAQNHPTGTCIDQIESQIERIEKPWKRLEKFLVEFKEVGKKSALSDTELRQRVRAVFSTLRWTIKDLAGEMGKLKEASAQPLQTLSSLLLLQTLDDIETHTRQALTKEECKGLLNQLKLGDLPASISAAISTVLKCSTEQERLTEAQFNEIQALRRSFVDLEMTLRMELYTGESCLAMLDNHDKLLFSTQQRVIDLSHAVQGITTKADAATQKLDQAKEDQDIALVALRIGLESRLEKLNGLANKKGHPTGSDAHVTGLANTLLTCMAASITAAITVKAISTSSWKNDEPVTNFDLPSYQYVSSWPSLFEPGDLVSVASKLGEPIHRVKSKVVRTFLDDHRERWYWLERPADTSRPFREFELELYFETSANTGQLHSSPSFEGLHEAWHSAERRYATEDQWYIPAKDILSVVIFTDITLYMGRTAVVKMGFRDRTKEGKPAFGVSGSHKPTRATIQDLRNDSQCYLRLQRAGRRESYELSQVRQSRKFWGPSESPTAFHSSKLLPQAPPRPGYYQCPSGEQRKIDTLPEGTDLSEKDSLFESTWSRYVEEVILCCNCGDGPMLVSCHAACIHCGHNLDCNRCYRHTPS